MPRFLQLEDRVLPVQHPRALVMTACDHGAKLSELLEGTGIRPAMLSDPEARISYRSFGQLSRNALRLTRNPGLGLDFGLRTQLTQLGMVALTMLSSRTRADGLRTGLRFLPIFAPAWDVVLESSPEQNTLRAQSVLPLGDLRAFAAEALLVGLCKMYAFMLGGGAKLLSLQLDYARPPYAARYASILQPEVLQFECGGIELVFDVPPAQPFDSADPATHRLAEVHCDRELAKLPGRKGLVLAVRGLLAEQAGPSRDLPAVARALHTSPRALRRQLDRLGTSFQRLRDEVRRDLVLSELQRRDAPFEAIARDLGFSDVRSLRRSVRRWTGLSPSDYREKARSQLSAPRGSQRWNAAARRGAARPCHVVSENGVKSVSRS